MKIKETIRCGIIGCGSSSKGRGGEHSISYAHGWAYAKHPHTILVSAVSRNQKNVSDFAKEFNGIHKYQDYREMLKKETLDMVSICAFPFDREKMIMDSLNSGVKIIWSEKPFALSINSAKKMIKKAKEKNARIYVNHQRRFGKPFELAKNIIEKRKIGNVLSIDIVQEPGCIFNTHQVDMALFFLGNRILKMVMAACDVGRLHSYQNTVIDEHLVASVYFDDVRLTIEAGKKVSQKLPIIRVQGSEGFVELYDQKSKNMKSILRASLKNKKVILNPSLDENYHDITKVSVNKQSYCFRVLNDIITSWKKGFPSRIDATEALRGVEVIMGAYESARRQKLLHFPIKQDLFPLDNWK